MREDEHQALVAKLLSCFQQRGSAYEVVADKLAQVEHEAMASENGEYLFDLIRETATIAAFLREAQDSASAVGALMTLANRLADRLEQIAVQDIRTGQERARLARSMVNRLKLATGEPKTAGGLNKPVASGARLGRRT